MRSLSTESHLRTPLNVILGTGSVVRVLRELVLSEKSLGAAHLAKRLGLSRPSTGTALDRLASMALVEPASRGRYPTYRIVYTHPLAEALVGLFRLESGVVDELVSAVLEALHELDPFPEAAWLYGRGAGWERAAGRSTGTERGPTDHLELLVVREHRAGDSSTGVHPTPDAHEPPDPEFEPDPEYAPELEGMRVALERLAEDFHTIIIPSVISPAEFRQGLAFGDIFISHAVEYGIQVAGRKLLRRRA